jgi:hypothetical protein
MSHENEIRFPTELKIYTFAGMEFVHVPEGEFLMGAGDQDPDAKQIEKPQHKLFPMIITLAATRSPMLNI